ncbi:zinc metalloproteinase nas-6-like isoform X2 [Actinia tenebrosa]|uniref:Metalloendopeptidase n=1 Tax=Actinia tenebrosa TaxID=6105 RepID=A0A6P8HW91_ACTTE|nr:zinc metalloproteinase nas-6-like isoform X2 [Actinia tenebrosa]
MWLDVWSLTTKLSQLYVYAAPVVIEDTKKSSKKKARIPRTVLALPRQRQTSRPKEPWEINQKILGLQGRLFDGNPFFQGDIILDHRTRNVVQGGFSRRRRAVKRLSKYRWPRGIIPYVISKGIAPKTRREIKKGIRHWRRKTCLHFRHKRTNDTDYIKFVNEPGCWSYVGRAGGEQKISIGAGCEFVGTVIHEIGHAVGFWHEQSRRDRDDYIKIVKDNIEPSAEAQFKKLPNRLMDSMGYAYDFESIMHYGPKFYSKNGKATIKIRKVGRRIGARIGQRKGLSWIDIAQVHAMYKCNVIPSHESVTCFNSSTGNGRDYRGKLNYTVKGVMCQPWSQQWPHQHNEMNDPIRAANDGLGDHSYCRNPRGRKSRPWCYTTLKRTVWQYCDIKICRSAKSKRGT